MTFRSLGFSILCLASLASCATNSPKRQAFPALDQEIHRHAKAGKAVVYPKLTHSVKPEYPALPAAGSAWAVMKVNTQGKVDEVKVIGEAPELYQQAIHKALRQWQFRPGTVDGQPAAFPMQVKVTFKSLASMNHKPTVGERIPDGIQMENERWIIRSVFPDLYHELMRQKKAGAVVKAAEVVKLEKADYPDPRAEGAVWVAFVVNEKAQAEQIHIIGDTPKLFQDALTRALKKSQFQTATVDGKPHAYPAAVKWTFSSQTVFMLRP
ncbi:MAG TPA: energy transducer TonB [Prosthecobacter sp.]